MTEASAAAVGTDLTAHITINASVETLWEMISDPEQMPRWSPQVVTSHVLGGPARLGSRFINLNRQDWKRWPTTAKVVRYAPESDFAFRVTENRTIWSFQLQANSDGTTTVTHRRETPDGISGLSSSLTKAFLGGKEAFTAEMLEGMSRTLERIKSDAESR